MAMAKNMPYARNDNILLNLGMFMISGIYRIYSQATGESYYGSSRNIKRRFVEHRSLWKRGGGNHKIRSLIKLYGVSNLKLEIIEECSPDEFEIKERNYISLDEKRLNVWILPFSSKGCNLGEHVKGKKFIGHKHTEEVKQKITEKIREYYKNNDGYWKGKSMPEEFKNKVTTLNYFFF